MKTWATTSCGSPSAVAAITDPTTVATVEARIAVSGPVRVSHAPPIRLATAMLAVRTPNAMPPSPSDSPRSLRATGNRGDSSCSPTVTARYDAQISENATHLTRSPAVGDRSARLVSAISDTVCKTLRYAASRRRHHRHPA